MNTNKITILGSVIVILIIISIPTIFKVISLHHNNLYKVVEEKIITVAKECYYANDCSDKITLKELYEKGKLEKVANPVTKEYYNELSYIQVKNDKFEFIVVDDTKKA